MFKPVSVLNTMQPGTSTTNVSVVVDTNSAMDTVFQRNQDKLIQAGANLPELRVKVQEMVQGFNAHDRDSIAKLGSNAGQRVVNFSEKLLQQVKCNDVEGMGEKLNEVVVLAKGVDVNGLIKTGSSKIPIIGGLINRFKVGKEQILGKYDTLSKQIEKLVTDVKSTQGKLRQRITDLENVYTYNTEEYYNLEMTVLVGEVKLEELRSEMEQRKASPSAQDPMEAQHMSDLQDVINRLEKRVHDLKTMQVVAIQTAPMIRMIQANNQGLIDKFQNLQELTIPSWKKQFTLAIALIEQKRAVELTQKIDDATNDLLKQNADLLKQNSIATARANQRSVVDIETLEHVQQTLISTIEEVQQIQIEGEQKRKDAVAKMEDMKKQLIERVM